MKEPGPADFMRAGKSQGATITAKDITEGGKVVETTLHVKGMGVTVRYFRSLERCKSRLLAERQGVEKDVGRYR
jgi:hypothetical protein